MKFMKKIPAKKYYTPEELHHNFDLGTLINNELLCHHTAKALSKLSINIVSKVLKKCYFTTFDYFLGEYIDAEHI